MSLAERPQTRGARQRGVPWSEEDERALIGGLMVWQDRLPDVQSRLSASDMLSPTLSLMFVAIQALHGRGEPFGPREVLAECRRMDPGSALTDRDVADLHTSAPRPTSALVHRITNLAALRRVALVLDDSLSRAMDMNTNAAELLEEVVVTLGKVEVPTEALPAGVMTVHDRGQTPAPGGWVVDRLIGTGHRVMIVAPPAAGKSTILRQIAAAAGQGIHPFTFRRHRPVRTLLVDLENPADVLHTECRRVDDPAVNSAGAGYDPDRTWLWHHRRGLELRSRTGRAKFITVLEATRPELVCVGPLYKTFRRGGDSWEQAAGEVQDVFDDLIDRYGFGLILEHHMPKTREATPYGSAMWEWWLEMGVALVPADPRECPGARVGSLRLEWFKPARLAVAWPERLDRGQSGCWPWSGWYGSGMPDAQGEF